MNIGERKQRFFWLVPIGGILLYLVVLLSVPRPRPGPPLLPTRIVIQASQIQRGVSAPEVSPVRWEGIEPAERINEQMMRRYQQHWKAPKGPSAPLAPSIRSTAPVGIEEGR